ncbi:MAG: hypothetical protein K1X57_13555 [Gemmataceae bacterium]|nr:hypothetical protein [Gemmataceae bacterium]
MVLDPGFSAFVDVQNDAARPISTFTADWREESIRKGIDDIKCRLNTNVAGARLAGRLLTDIHPLLRSKPENTKEIAASISGAASNPNAAGVVFVLASPTAVQETPHFLKCADLFRSHLGVKRLDVVLVRWENLVNDTHKPLAVRQAEFDEIVANTGDMIEQNGWDVGLLHSVNVTTGDDWETKIEGPPAFADADAVVRGAARICSMGNSVDPLATDLKWIVDFYGRQHSLNQLGPRQPLLDLAIRQEVGRAVSAGKLWNGRPLPHNRLCLTSELNPRLVKCYRFKSANLNISVGNY